MHIRAAIAHMKKGTEASAMATVIRHNAKSHARKSHLAAVTRCQVRKRIKSQADQAFSPGRMSTHYEATRPLGIVSDGALIRR